MPVVVGVLVVSLNHEAIVGELQPLFEHPFADYLDREAIQFPDWAVLPSGSGVLGYLLQTLSEDLLVGGIHAIHPQVVEAVALLVGLHHREKAVPVLRHGIHHCRIVTQFARL